MTCNDYTTYHVKLTKRGFPVVHLTSTCQDQDGTTIHMEGYFVDRGEPGTLDSARLYFDYTHAPDLDQDPGAIADTGHIQSGNIQIHTSTSSSELTPS